MGNRNGGSRKKNKESVYKYAEPNVADETPKKATNNNAPQRQFSHSGPSNNYRPGSAVGHSNGYTPQSGASTVGSASHQAYPSASVQNHSNKNNLPSTTAPSATKPAKSNTSKHRFLSFGSWWMLFFLNRQITLCGQLRFQWHVITGWIEFHQRR